MDKNNSNANWGAERNAPIWSYMLFVCSTQYISLCYVSTLVETPMFWCVFLWITSHKHTIFSHVHQPHEIAQRASPSCVDCTHQWTATPGLDTNEGSEADDQWMALRFREDLKGKSCFYHCVLGFDHIFYHPPSFGNTKWHLVCFFICVYVRVYIYIIYIYIYLLCTLNGYKHLWSYKYWYN